MSIRDEAHMREALALAARGRGRTRPNPPVGAVVVKRNAVAGRGLHRYAGGPHAEIYALRQAGKGAVGATLYVTLEPCSTAGRTGACTDAIIQAGIKRVVYGVRDPNPQHRGKGLRVLRRAGIEVVCGPCRHAAQELIAPFAMTMQQGRPWVTLKMASTLDGRIADAAGASRWITGKHARRMVHNWRKQSDAVMVGAGTVAADDPQLLDVGKQRLYRLIVDRDGVLNSNYRVFQDDFASMTRVITCDNVGTKGLDSIEAAGIDIWRIPRRMFLPTALQQIYSRLGLLQILCEGGGQLAAGLIAVGMVDEMKLFMSGRVLGANAVPVVGAVKGWNMQRHPLFKWTDVLMAGEDVLLTGRPVQDFARR